MLASAPRRRPRLWLSAVAIVVSMLPALSHAGTIGFRITARVTTGPGVRVALDVTHTGDEAASNVVATAVLEQRAVSAPAVRQIAPRGTQSFEIAVQDEDLPPGSYVLVTRMSYEDTNGYPFEVLSVTSFDVAARRRSAVSGTLAIPALGVSGTVDGRLVMKAPKDRGQRYAVEVFAPRGVQITPSKAEVEVANGSAELAIKVDNAGMIAGNTAAIYALVRSLDESPPQTDTIRGSVRALALSETIKTRDLIGGVAALFVALILLEIVTWRRRRSGASIGSPTALAIAGGWALASASSVFLLTHYPWDALLAPTVTAGGDMASLYFPTKLMAEEMLPRGQLTGWTMGNYAGFPILHFYSTLPFALIAVLGHLIPMTIAFKLVTLLGPTTLPLAAAYLFRRLDYSPAAAAIAAASTLPFLLQQGNSMWGGNIPSVLAGEFCHSIGLTLGLVFIGYLRRVVVGRGSWTLAALLLAVIGLCHTFSFFAAAWYSLYFLRPAQGSAARTPIVFAMYVLAGLLLCFWGLPLPPRLVYTTEWSMIWHIKDWKEVLPQALWPPAILAAANCLLMLFTLKKFSADRSGLLLFNVAGGILLYFLVPAIGFPDIRFIPVAQLFTCLLAADLIAWVGKRLRYPLAYATCVIAATLTWGHVHLGYIPAWLKWNYSGYEGKPTWPLFKSINDHIAGTMNDPRVMFEHSEVHNRFGSSRAFENIPLFSGRSTLEGVFHQASQNSPFIFYLQSEASERASGPFGQYTYARLDPARALPHMRLYNVSQIVTVTDKAKAAYDANPAFERTFSSGAYAVYKVRELDTRYVIPAANEPVLFEGEEWKLAFYRWYKHPELLDIPLVPNELITADEARKFALRTDTVARLPKVPLEDDCEVTSKLEDYRITFDTTCPGKPHIVKVSYFPRWSAGNTGRLFPVSPGFMLVYPNGPHVEISYVRTALDRSALALSLFGLAFILIGSVSQRPRALVVGVLARVVGPPAQVLERRRTTASILLALVMIAAGASTRLSLREPDRDYQTAQEAYRNRDFESAIRLLEEWTTEDRDTFKQATALHQLGVAYNEIGQYASAVQVLERLRFEFPNVDYGAATVFNLAKAWLALGATDRAKGYASLLEVNFADSGLNQRLRKEAPALFSES